MSLAQPLLVGVSGGPDSLCLLDMLHKSGYRLAAACLDHGLRPEASQDASRVQQICERYGVSCVVKAADTRAYASQHGLSIEAAARWLRYEFLFGEAEKACAQAVLVGHTADDQAETILMNILRGAGIAGLKGMEVRSWMPALSEAIPLVRPLLFTWRHEVLAYCQANHLEPVMDASNASRDYFRNRIRHEVLPYLEQFQPHLREHLATMGQTLSGDHALVMVLVEAAWKESLAEAGEGWLSFDRGKVMGLPIPIQRHLIRRAMLSTRSALQDVEWGMIERARQGIHARAATVTLHLGAGLRLVCEQNRAWFAALQADLPQGGWPAFRAESPALLAVPGVLPLASGWIIEAEWLDTYTLPGEAEMTAASPDQIWLDADALEMPLLVRMRQPGDRLRPLGMGGKRIKLSDLMINLKLPQRSRAAWPLVCAGEEIVWVVGCRGSDAARLRENTTRVIHLALKQAEAQEALS